MNEVVIVCDKTDTVVNAIRGCHVTTSYKNALKWIEKQLELSSSTNKSVYDYEIVIKTVKKM